MAEHFGHMLAVEGETEGRLEVRCPFDDTVIGSVEQVGEEMAMAAMQAAHALYRDRSAWLSVTRRIEILERTAQIMGERAEALALAAASEGGKPLMDSRVEVARAIEGVHLCVESLKHHRGEVVPMGISGASSQRIAFTQLEPIGVVMAVSAFNHPLNLIVHQVGPAVAAGCPVIVKPAGTTPLSCMRFVAMLREAGLPDGWCQAIVPTSTTVATQLVAHPNTAFFSFIGSARVGWMLRSKLPAGARCALEHGGVAPAIVAEDADLDAALPALLKGGFYHAGQVCVSVQRIFAHESIATQLAESLAAGALKLKVGDPRDPDTEVGPLISSAEVERVSTWVDEARAAGAQVLCGGQALNNNCYAPTVLVNPPADATISQNEVFGPVVCIYTYSDIDQAIAQANSLDVSFQAAVFTRNLDTAMYVYRHIDASAVMVNDHTAFRVDWMPFAGLRSSGHGVGGIGHTFEEMTINKMAVIHSAALPKA